MFNCVFVQNDNTKEVLNCAKSRHYALDVASKTPTGDFKYSKPLPMPIIPVNRPVFTKITGTDNIESGFNYEMFEAGFPPSGWTIVNTDGGVTWASTSYNGPTYGGAHCTYMNFYAYGTSGAVDKLVSRTYSNIDLSDTLKFDWAYAQYSASYTDRMQVLVSTDGGTTFPYTIFDKSGSTLATAPTTTSEFFPSSSQWGSFKIRFGNIITSIQTTSNEVPSSYSLSQNYPNPFNPTTNINFDLPKNGNVSLKVYDILGNAIQTLYEGYKPAGSYSATFDGSHLSSGIYFIKIATDNFSDVKKMVLSK